MAIQNVTILGYGTMGKAIASALTLHDANIKIFPADKDESFESVKTADVIILSVKPQDASDVLTQIKKDLRENTVLLSIMAGTSMKKIAEWSGHAKIVRMMPNLGLSVGAGIAAWTSNGLNDTEKKEMQSFIDKISENFETKDEDTINKVTALSGSGPAYFFYFAQALLDGAKKIGLSETESRLLVEKTFSAASILGKNENYQTLITKVKSKGGTTEAALEIFEKEKLEAVVEDAVAAAYKRAQDLSN
jgi:pyrroline-5-carboxylate reductase